MPPLSIAAAAESVLLLATVLVKKAKADRVRGAYDAGPARVARAPAAAER
jgi:hypothetical protein